METRTKNRKGKKKISKDAAQGGLSHFVAPLYVAPSTTPSNATPEASTFVIFFCKLSNFANFSNFQTSKLCKLSNFQNFKV